MKSSNDEWWPRGFEVFPLSKRQQLEPLEARNKMYATWLYQDFRVRNRSDTNNWPMQSLNETSQMLEFPNIETREIILSIKNNTGAVQTALIIGRIGLSRCFCDEAHFSRVTTKPVIGVSDKVRHKPGCTATEDV